MATATSSCPSGSTSDPRPLDWAVRRVDIADLRCWDRQSLDLESGLIVVSGPNGAGKTSLVEAVCYGLVGVSPRTTRDVEAVRTGAAAFHVTLTVEGRQGTQVREIGYQAGVGRRLRIDGEPCRSLGAWRASGSILVFLPEELRTVKGPPAARRRAVDRLLEGVDPAFADESAAYTAALTQRNAMLKRVRQQLAGPSGLAPWDHAVATHGGAVAAARSRVIVELAPRFRRWLDELGGGATGELAWEPSPADLGAGDPGEFTAVIAARLAATRQRDVQAAQTLSGPHRDDLWIGAGGQDLRRTGSQGEQRTAVLALLLACRDLLRAHGTTPILLLDDVLSELDPRRRERLLSALSGEGQSWITSADPDTAGLAASSGATRVLRVERGGVVDAA